MSKQYKRGLVVGKFAPPHWGHVLMIEEAMRRCETLIVFVYSNPDMKGYPTLFRAQDLEMTLRRGRLSNTKPFGCNLHVIPYSSGSPLNSAPPKEQRDWVVRRYKIDFLTEGPDVVIGAEEYVKALARDFNCAYYIEPRYEGMQATAIRREPYAFPQVEWLTPETRQWYDEHYAEKVVFLGAESTGKTTTARTCAHNLHGAFVHEVGAEVFQDVGGKMADESLWDFTVNEQKGREDRAIANSIKYRYIFCDTEAMTTKFFMYWMKGYASDVVKQAAREAKSRYHHWFLCDDGIPFDGGNMRGPEEVRKMHQGMLKMMLDDAKIDYTLLTGTTGERVNQVAQELHAVREKDWVDLSGE